MKKTPQLTASSCSRKNFLYITDMYSKKSCSCPNEARFIPGYMKHNELCEGNRTISTISYDYLIL